MAHSPNSPTREPQVPAAMLKQRRADWHWFTHTIAIHCVAIAGLLVFLLLVFRIL